MFQQIFDGKSVRHCVNKRTLACIWNFVTVFCPAKNTKFQIQDERTVASSLK